ncbi:hypothetical protein Tco_0013896 [Tanacetum coccineum]
MHIQQRGPNKGRRRVADIQTGSREIRTEEDEEQHTYTDSTAERSEQRQTKSKSGRQTTSDNRQQQTTPDSGQSIRFRQTSDLDRQQTDACRHNQPGRQQIDASRQNQPDNI